MQRLASIVSMGLLLLPNACKHKNNLPAPAGSAGSAVTAPLATSAAPSAGAFEGEIALLANGKFAGSDATPVTATLLIKGNRVRVELPASLTAARGLGPAYLLAFPAEKKAYAILETRKQAILLEFDKLAEQAKSFGGRPRPPAGAASPTPGQLVKTGKVDTVAGTACEIWHFNQAKNEGDLCIAEQDTDWFHFPNASAAPAELTWLSPIADGKHLPLRFVATEQSVERGRIEVTSIQKKTLPDSPFELPADYTVLSVEQLIGSMLGGLAGPGMQLPPGLKLPPGVRLAPDTKLPHRK